MNKKIYSLLAASVLLAGATACNDDDDWGKVDGAKPTTELEASHIQAEAGYAINIKGLLSDADGISTIKLWCPDLYLKKTIDIIDIYGEPLKEYQLDYSFKIERYKKGEEYLIEVTVTDVCGNEDVKTVKVTLDGDFTAPVFVAAPASESTVLMEEGKETIFELEFTVTDNIGIDYVVVNINKYDLSTKEIGESVDPDNYPMTVQAYGEDTYEFSEGVILPDEAGVYYISIVAYDMPAQFDEVRSTTVEGVLTVLGGVDFPKMYLADVKTAAELNSDIFGVPMRVDKTGECQYRARYYNEKANTEIFFIPQKNALSPICYGVDPTDASKLINSPGNVEPIVLPLANTYYEINFNTDSGEYEFHSYEVADYMDPVFWGYHTENCNYWWAWADTGTDDWVPADDAWMRDFFFGYTEGDLADITEFAIDANNPHLYYWTDPKHYDAGTDMHFIIHNWHENGWWNFVTWRVDDSKECDIFYYYGNAAKQAYLDWWLGEGVAEWKKWGDEGYRKNILYGGAGDQWAEPHVNASGDYLLYFDTHLGRAKLVPAK